MAKYLKQNGVKSVIAILLMVAVALQPVFLSGIKASAGTISSDGTYYTDYNTLKQAQEAAAVLNVEIAAEGDVLLKNENNALPFVGNEYVSIFGISQVNVCGGAQQGNFSTAGSGGMSVGEALEEEGLRVNKSLWNYYKDVNSNAYGSEKVSFTKGIENSFEVYGDAAVIIFSRQGGEGQDISVKTSEAATVENATAFDSTKEYAEGDAVIYGGLCYVFNQTHKVGAWTGADAELNYSQNVHEALAATVSEAATVYYKHILQLTDSEEQLLKYVESQKFGKIIVIINSSTCMELGDIQNDSNIDSVLWIGRPGENGLKALAQILVGKVNPSGKLVDIYASDFTQDPTWQNAVQNAQTGSSYTYIKADGTSTGYNGIDYEEDIYLGYRYYETAAYEASCGNYSGYDYAEQVVYPFGYGLSYSSFAFDAMNVFTDKACSQTLSHTADADSLFASSVGHPAAVKTLYAQVKVTNTGAVAGKETVQIYITAPYTGAVEKSFVTMVGFGKTDVLQPGQSQIVTIEIDAQDMASYDATGASGDKGYVLEAGDYVIRAMADSHSWAGELTADEADDSAESLTYGFVIGGNTYMHLDGNTDNEIENLCSKENGSFYTLRDNTSAGYEINVDATANETLMKRSNFASTFPQTPTKADLTWSAEMIAQVAYWVNFYLDGSNAANYSSVEDIEDVTQDYADIDSDYPWVAEAKAAYESGRNITQKTAETATHPYRLSEMAGINPNDAVNKIASGAFEGLTGQQAWDAFLNEMTWDEIRAAFNRQKVAMDSIDMARLNGADSTINLSNTYQWNDNPISGATFNVKLIEKQGIIIANLGLLQGINTWWGNSMDMHRSPFGGRCYEYYSQDPTLSAYMAAAETGGAQSRGLNCCIKHFACNDQESSRTNLFTWVSEQALREIYLKPFRYAIEKGHATALMGAMNRIGRVHIYGNYNITEKMLRGEWNFLGGYTTDAYSTRTAIADQLVRCNLNHLDNANNLSGTWDATLREGKGDVLVGAKDSQYESFVQYYCTRRAAMWTLYMHANTAINYNGYDLSSWEKGATLQATQAVAATGLSVAAPVSDVRYTITSGELPEGLTLNELTGVISGTALETGSFSIQISAAVDNWITFGARFTLNVASAFVLDSDNNLGELALGEEISGYFGSEVVLLKNYNQGIVYTVDAGALPQGVVLGEDGELSGSATEVGTFDATIKVVATNVTTDSCGCEIRTVNTYFFPVKLVVADNNEYVTVTFGSESAKIVKGTKFSAPEAAAKVGYNFVGWYADEALTTQFDFTAAINADTTIFAKYSEILSVSSAEVNADGHLIVTYSNGATADLGSVKGITGAKGDKGDTGATGAIGATGTQGIGISKAEINDEGHLIVTLTNSQTVDAGVVVAKSGCNSVIVSGSIGLLAIIIAAAFVCTRKEN